MGLFNRDRERGSTSPAIEAPAPKQCLCGANVPAAGFPDHLDTHIREVIAPGGHPGRSFDCPKCGPSDLVYGQPGEHPISLRNMSHALFRQHCTEAHGLSI